MSPCFVTESRGNFSVAEEFSRNATGIVTIGSDATIGLTSVSEVPYGTYYIVERDASAEGYTLVATYTVDGSSTSNKSADIVLSADDPNGAAQVTNAYTPIPVDIRVTKVWDDNGNPDRTAAHLASAYRLRFTDEQKQAFLDDSLRLSVHDAGVIPTTEAHILTLSTCTGVIRSNRWVIQAVLEGWVISPTEFKLLTLDSQTALLFD